MLVTHSPVEVEFASLRFDTSVDGAARYETVVNYLESNWSTSAAGDGGPIVLRGELSPAVPDNQAAASIQPAIEAAIAEGRI